MGQSRNEAGAKRREIAANSRVAPVSASTPRTYRPPLCSPIAALAGATGPDIEERARAALLADDELHQQTNGNFRRKLPIRSVGQLTLSWQSLCAKTAPKAADFIRSGMSAADLEKRARSYLRRCASNAIADEIRGSWRKRKKKPAKPRSTISDEKRTASEIVRAGARKLLGVVPSSWLGVRTGAREMLHASFGCAKIDALLLPRVGPVQREGHARALSPLSAFVVAFDRSAGALGRPPTPAEMTWFALMCHYRPTIEIYCATIRDIHRVAYQAVKKAIRRHGVDRSVPKLR